MKRVKGLEPLAPYLASRRSNQLSYTREVDPAGFEPATSAMSRRRSNQLSYGSEWAVQDSNLRHPSCKEGALPTELTSRSGELGTRTLHLLLAKQTLSQMS